MSTSESADKPRKGFLSWVAIDLTPLKTSRDYRLLFAGQFVSAFGSAISYVVLPWQMYQLTKSSFAVGMLGVAEVVPMFLMAFVGDRKVLLELLEDGACFPDEHAGVPGEGWIGDVLFGQLFLWLLFEFHDAIDARMA